MLHKTNTIIFKQSARIHNEIWKKMRENIKTKPQNNRLDYKNFLKIYRWKNVVNL